MTELECMPNRTISSETKTLATVRDRKMHEMTRKFWSTVIYTIKDKNYSKINSNKTKNNHLQLYLMLTGLWPHLLFYLFLIYDNGR